MEGTKRVRWPRVVTQFLAGERVTGYFRFREWILFVFMSIKRNYTILLFLPFIYIPWRYTENNLRYSLRHGPWDNRAQPSLQALVTSVTVIIDIWWVREHTEGSTDHTDCFFSICHFVLHNWKFEAALEDYEIYELFKDSWTFYGL